MKPAPRAMKYLRTSSFQCLRATTMTPPATFARAAAVPRSRLQAAGDNSGMFGARDDNTFEAPGMPLHNQHVRTRIVGMSSWLTAGVCRLLLSLAGAPVEG